MPVPLHTTGKASFDDIYDRPDPREYYARMSELDYRIPELAKPFFEQQIREFRAVMHGSPEAADPVTVLDIGCSYGVNAALMRFDTTIGELAEHYRSAGEADRAELVERDRARLAAKDAWPGVRFVGIDASGPALEYAEQAGLLHEVVHADLEAADPTDDQREALARADLVVSTGCIGYVTEKTITRIAAARPDRLPWMAHFVLRMFDFTPIAAELDALGYRTEQLPGLYKQRRFASPVEQRQVLTALADNEIDTRGHESEGWLCARLFLSRPDPERRP
ncbi:class I SAM-dependent methyltransferase [Nocardia shimofusensis]|uniref:class I SAM-dependent methyltransferase n=1 Tax=Nocardia shimofusensis TaxID=228596 RepID=UPI00157C18E6|nr:class I SAM-dependent methyltransferase [Nocardia shimofusensis]